MSFPNWREPARYLRQEIGPVSAEQRELASVLGVRVGQRSPALIVAAMLRDHLADHLREPQREPSHGQLEYLRDLDGWAKPADPSPRTAALASALIRLREARQALKWLQALKLEKGDVVVEFRHSDLRDDGDLAPDRQRIVSSISQDGTVHFDGGGGYRAKVSRLELRFRAGDTSKEAVEARTAAEAVAAIRREADAHQRTMSGAKYRRMADRFVSERDIYARDVDALRGVIETAADERPIQKFLTQRPHLLTVVLSSNHGGWLQPQVRLGDKYVADFFIADADSTGIRWRLVELESPRAAPLLQSGEWGKEARHALYQIESWRHWLREHPDSARKPREDEGLGLIDIEAGVPGLVLIGRRATVAQDPAWSRRALAIASGVEMHTYDWFLERVEAVAMAPTALR